MKRLKLLLLSKPCLWRLVKSKYNLDPDYTIYKHLLYNVKIEIGIKTSSKEYYISQFTKWIKNK